MNGTRPHPLISPRTFFWVSTPAPHLSYIQTMYVYMCVVRFVFHTPYVYVFIVYHIAARYVQQHTCIRCMYSMLYIRATTQSIPRPPYTHSDTHTHTQKHTHKHILEALICHATHRSRGGGLGSRPKKMYGERLGDGVEYHFMKTTPRR